MLRLEVSFADTMIKSFGLIVTSSFSDFCLSESFKMTVLADDDEVKDVDVVIRLVPSVLRWPEGRNKIEVADLVRRYHQCMCYAMLPDKSIQPSIESGLDAGNGVKRQPTGALLVKLEGSAYDVVSDQETCSAIISDIAGEDMELVVDKDRKRRVSAMLDAELLFDDDVADDDRPLGAKAEQAWHADSIFYGSALDVPTLANLTNSDKPSWLLSVIHRVFRLFELRDHAAESLAGTAAWHPVLLEQAITTYSQARQVQNSFNELRMFGEDVW